MNQRLIDSSKELFFKRVDDFKSDPWDLRTHIREAEKWAQKLLKKYPNANEDVIFLTLYLHDIGHYPIPKGDHAVVSKKIAKDFLKKQKVDPKISKNVLHCIRSHRNGDVKPETPEAKLFVLIDSVSHLTYMPYVEMALDNRLQGSLEKLERDYRDIKPFPDVLKEVTPLYKAIKKLLMEYGKIAQ